MRNIYKITSLIILFLSFIIYPNNDDIQAQLVINNTFTPTQLVQDVLLGSGITASNITFTGGANSIGYFSNGASTNLSMNSGVILSCGDIFDAPGPNLAGNTSTNTGGGSDPDLAALIPGYSVYDATYLEFDFIPQSDTVRFKYIFSSEEYPEWVNSNFNDVFGFFITGPNPLGGNYNADNIALIPGTALPVTIDNVNNVIPSYPQYYVDNTGGVSIEYDGFTTVLTAWALVEPCQQYHIKIAVGDAGDHIYDSAVFLEENSFSSPVVNLAVDFSKPIAGDTAIEGCVDANISFTIENILNYDLVVHYLIGGTAINGIDYVNIPDSVTILAGTDSAAIQIIPLMDFITEGTEYVSIIAQTSPCSFDTVEVYILDNIPLDVIMTPDTSFCGSANMLLEAYAINGIPPYSYHWSTGDTTSNINVSINNTQTYYVTVTDACGGIIIDSVYIEIFDIPVLTTTANPSAICLGDNSNIAATSNITGTTFNWNNGLGAGANHNVSPAATLILIL